MMLPKYKMHQYPALNAHLKTLPLVEVELQTLSVCSQKELNVIQLFKNRSASMRRDAFSQYSF